MHPLYSIPVFATSIGVFAFGLLVLLRNPSKKLTQLYFWCSVSVAVWSFGYGLLYSTDVPEKALFYARFGYIGVVFIPTFFCHFVIEFLGEVRKLFLGICYVCSFIFLLISRSSMFLDGTYVYFWGLYPKAGPLYIYFILYFYGCFGTCVFYLLKAFLRMKKEKSAYIKLNQVKYVFLAFCVASANVSDYLPNYKIEIYPGAYLAAAGWLIIMAYGTLRYRLLDINLIIRKTLIYSVVTGALTGVYLAIIALFAKIFQGFTGYQTVFSSAMAAGLITVCFQPLRKRVQAFIDGKFFRQYVDREEKLYELSREVITHTTPEAMAESLVRVLGETLHPKSVALYLRARDGDGFVQVTKSVEAGLPSKMPESNPLTDYFRDHPQPFVQEPPSESGETLDTRRPARKGEAA
jgi:two-component system, NtrC family, sensor kinase